MHIIYDEKECDVLCFVPYYKHNFYDYESYDINRFLGYFRNRLLDKNVTFISNDCTAGEMYRMFDLRPASPTYYMIIPQVHYVKFLLSIDYYMGIDLKDMFWMKNAFRKDKAPEFPAGRLDDIELWFVHDRKLREARNRWNELRINYEGSNNVLILSEHPSYPPLSAKVINEFNELKTWKKMVLLRGKQAYFLHSANEYDSDVIYMTESWFRRRDVALENQFSILDWLGDEEQG